MSDDITQALYRDIAAMLNDCPPETVERTITTLCHHLTGSHMTMALLLYWLIREGHSDHVAYKQFMMVYQREKGEKEEVK